MNTKIEEKEHSFIYKATNTINGKAYVGQSTVSLDDKKRQHIANINQKPIMHFKIYEAMREFDEKNFEWEIVEYVEDVTMLDEREIYWIAHFGSYEDGYNSTVGGKGTKGLKRTVETNRKQSESMLGVNVGSASGMSKLTESDVREIKMLLLMGMYQEDIAEAYRVGSANISQINRGYTWKHVELEVVL